VGDTNFSERPRRVLVIDDDPEAAESLTRLLDVMGHEAAYVTHSAEAVSFAKSFGPEIAFIDLAIQALTVTDSQASSGPNLN
jgi:CheY-like chemotaxis protein